MGTLVSAAVPVTTFLLMLAVGMDLTTADFARVRNQRSLVLAGLLAPLVLLPAAAAAMLWLLSPPPEVAAGVLLLAACPIGSVSNVCCQLARASSALAITLTGLSSLGAGLTIPLVGQGMALALGRPLELRAPVPLLATQLVLMLLLPVALGMWSRHRVPALAERGSPILQRLSVGGILFVFTLLILSNPAAFAAGLSTTVPLAAAFVGLSVVLGWATAAAITRSPADRFAIAAGFGARNVGVATAIAVTILGRLEFAHFAATYALVELPMLLAVVWIFRKAHRSSALAPPSTVRSPQSM
jgi:BASS family bile acid:Na+ symporter